MEYTDYAFNRRTGEVVKIVSWEWGGFVKALDTKRQDCFMFKVDLIHIPKQFRAYIKEDTAYHGLNDTYQELRLDDDNDFFNNEKKEKLWFKTTGGWNVPDRDIDFEKIYKPIDFTSTYTVPPMPSIEELSKCKITFDGRKTIVTYCDDFVGEAICHEDDVFKVDDGIAIAYARAYTKKLEFDKEQEKKNKIEVGDIVKIIKAGRNCSSYLSWVYEHIEDFSLVRNFAYEDMLMCSPDRFDNFTVKYIDSQYAYIEDCKNRKCRLIHIDGIALTFKGGK